MAPQEAVEKQRMNCKALHLQIVEISTPEGSFTYNVFN